MPHYLELPAAVRDALNKMAVVEIRPKVIFSGRSKVSTGTDPGGFQIFSAGYSQVVVDISDRCPKDEPITITQEKPIFPNGPADESISSSGINVSLVNTDTRMSCTQSGAIIDPESIEGGAVVVQARIGSVSQLLSMFTGRITGLPAEDFGQTTLSLLDSLFTPLQTELKYEDFGQNGYVTAGNLVTNGAEIIQGDGYLKFHDGYLCYDEAGNLFTSFENNKPEVIDLLDVRIKSGARLGIYTIDFLASGGYRVTFPDSSFLQGDVSTIFDSPAITINPQFWQIAPGVTNYAGVKITFRIRCNCEANPITFIKNYLEKAFLKNWGDIPSNTSAAAFPASALPVIWSTLDRLETQFRGVRIFVSIGNDSNKPFEKKPGGKPLNCITACMMASDHVASSILMDNNGDIRMQRPHIFNTPIYDLMDAYHIEQFSLMGLIKDNFATFNYGQNDSSGSYGKKIEHDLRSLVSTDIREVTINFPFYKIGPCDNYAGYFSRLFKKKIKLGHVRATMKVAAQFGIAFIPGDRIRVITSKQPVITKYFEIYKVNKSCAFQAVELEMIQIQTPEGVEQTPCNYSFCVGNLGV